MVLLSMSSAVVDAVQQYYKYEPEASIESSKEGDPISHSQLITITRLLKSKHSNIHLDQLLKGCSIYQPPKLPNPPKTGEFERVMAECRKDEESRKYAAMLRNSVPIYEKTQYANLMGNNLKHHDDEIISNADLNRQGQLILNTMTTVCAIAAFFWWMLRYWNIHLRLAISLAAGFALLIIEVFLFWSYLRHNERAKIKAKTLQEKRSIQETFTIEPKKSKRTTLKASQKEKSI